MTHDSPYLFISYSHEDHAPVTRLTAYLQNQGFRIWYDRQSLRPGTLDWEETIRHAIQQCAAIILVASPNSRRSRYVRDELNIADMYNRPIFPCWVEGQVWMDSIPMGWGSVQCVDARDDKYEVALPLLAKELFALTSEGIPRPLAPLTPDRTRIFLTFNYEVEQDRNLASEIETALVKQGHEVVISDQMSIPMGTSGATQITQRLRQCHYLVALISEKSANNEIMSEQLKEASQVSQPSGKQLQILPIRVCYQREFPYHLRQYVEHIPWSIWKQEQDTVRVLAEINAALNGGTLGLVTMADKATILYRPQLQHFPPPPPAADPKRVIAELRQEETSFYIERASDGEIQHLMDEEPCTLVIKAPRQNGKSSLLIRTCYQMSRTGTRIAFIDLQMLNSRTLYSESSLFKWFTRRIVQALNIQDVPDIDTLWNDKTGGAFACTQYFERYILNYLRGQHLVLAIDECDRLFESPFRSDFFGMLRHWHNNRSYLELWRHLSQILVISTEPYMLIENLNQSPFNVGTAVELNDFDEEQVAHLNACYGNPLSSSKVEELMPLIGGHPYLTREAFHQMAVHRKSLGEMQATLTHDTSPFADHLQHYLFLLSKNVQLAQTMQAVIQGHSNLDQRLLSRLQGAGLVRFVHGKVVPRCELYGLYFGKRLSLAYS